jgi:hypothetical protein
MSLCISSILACSPSISSLKSDFKLESAIFLLFSLPALSLTMRQGTLWRINLLFILYKALTTNRHRGHPLQYHLSAKPSMADFVILVPPA